MQPRHAVIPREYSGVGPAGTALTMVGLEQDPGASEQAGWGDAGTDEAAQFGPLLVGQGNAIGVKP